MWKFSGNFFVKHVIIVAFKGEENKMEEKCPYCGNELIGGYIQCRDKLYWSENIRKVAALPPIKSAQALGEQDVSIFKGTVNKAYNCKQCKRIIITYDGN